MYVNASLSLIGLCALTGAGVSSWPQIVEQPYSWEFIS
jgi:hypothetical protein